MPFDTSSMIAFQEREEEARKASMIPVGTYNWEIEKSEVTEVEEYRDYAYSIGLRHPRTASS